MLSIPSKYEQGYFARLTSSLSSHVSPALLLNDGWWEYQRALVDESGLSGRYHSITVLHAYISQGDEKQTHWLLQFRDVVLPHRHNHYELKHKIHGAESFLKS
jgi:hypothetical protein